MLPAGLRSRHFLSHSGDMFRCDAATPTNDLGPFFPPLAGEPCVPLRVDLVVKLPAGVEITPQIRIDTEGQIGKVAQPPDHPRHMVYRPGS